MEQPEVVFLNAMQRQLEVKDFLKLEKFNFLF